MKFLCKFGARNRKLFLGALTVKPGNLDSKAQNSTATNLESKNLKENDVNGLKADCEACTKLTVSQNAENYSKKLKKYAVLLSYCGWNYYGMQENKRRPTIEGKYFEALKMAKIIDPTIESVFYSLDYSRSSRTDAGVSAVQQIVSMLLPVDHDISLINHYLPDDIRVISSQRVTKGFKAQKFADARTYSYLIPTYAFVHVLKQPDPIENYRIDADTLKIVNDILQIYVGIHRFHNFTKHTDIFNPAAVRRIHSFTCSDPCLVGSLEVVQLQVKGMSFMLYQIRKMIGMVIAVMRGTATVDMMKLAFTEPKMGIPTAPGVGLMLEKIHFDYYNDVFGNIHEKIDWADPDFKRQYIIPYILYLERKEKVTEDYINHTMKRRSFDREETWADELLRIQKERESEWEMDLKKCVQSFVNEVRLKL